MIDLRNVCRSSSFDQWFSVFFIIHLANLKSVTIVQKSVKSQGIFQLMMSGNPDGDVGLNMRWGDDQMQGQHFFVFQK